MGKHSIFITGAAAGIGKTVAQLFASKGWFVGLYDVDVPGVEKLASELGLESVVAGYLDVTDPQNWQTCLDEFFIKTGRLDVLFNNAGILESGPFETIDLQKQLAVIDVNVKGVLIGCYRAFPYLKQTSRSRVINMASASAIYGQPSLAIYSASKFAVRGLTEALDLEWKDQGITVMDIMPLFVQTAMVKGMNANSIRNLGINLTPDDVAKVIWKAVHYKGKLPQVHWPVGFQTQLFYRLSGLTPKWINRWVNGLIASQR